MTPKQFFMLSERHREALVHTELHAGLIRAAVINYGPWPPKEPVSPLSTMFSHKEHKTVSSNPADNMTEEQLVAVSAWNLKVAQLAAEQRDAARREADDKRKQRGRRVRSTDRQA